MQLLNFANGNTTATFPNRVDDLITDTDLQKESENAADWFRSNQMALNLNKFQAITIYRLRQL